MGPFDADVGMAPGDLDVILRAKGLDLPAIVWEWYVLAANWNQGEINVWIHPQELAAHDAMVEILTDTHGINSWGVRIVDLGNEDPPVVSREENPEDIVFPSFSEFVAAMIINDVLFPEEAAEEVIELNPDATRAALTCLVASRVGDFLVDAPLESATVITFVYPESGPAYGKARTQGGRHLLQRLRIAGNA